MLRTVLVCFLILLGVEASSAQASTAIIRVHVLARASTAEVTIEAQDGPALIFLERSSTPLTTLQHGSILAMERSGSTIRLSFPGGTRTARVVEVVPAEAQRLRVRSGTYDRAYQGAISVDPDEDRRASLRLINFVPLEAYVASVVASEYPFTEPEGVKAQAILARTYALRAVRANRPFDVSDNTGSQVYHGDGHATPVTRRGTEATRGQVLRYGSALVEATYYSSSGGHTANNEDIWRGSPIPYLRGKPDPYDTEAPDYRWSTTAEASGTLRALGRRFGGQVSGFEISRRSQEGRVTRVRLLGTQPREISGNEFRSTVNGAFGARTVRSTHFSVERRGNRYVFEGRGFGHGVGMSQYGARARARAGHSYRDILAFYFTGTRLDTIQSSPPRTTPRDPVLPSPITLNDFRTAPAHEPVPGQQSRTGPGRQRSSGPSWAGNTETDRPARRTSW